MTHSKVGAHAPHVRGAVVHDQTPVVVRCSCLWITQRSVESSGAPSSVHAVGRASGTPWSPESRAGERGAAAGSIASSPNHGAIRGPNHKARSDGSNEPSVRETEGAMLLSEELTPHPDPHHGIHLLIGVVGPVVADGDD